MKKYRFWLFGISLVFFFSPSILSAAQTTVSDDAQKELASQTNSLVSEEKKYPLKIQAKPVIEVKKEPEKKSGDEGPRFFVKKIRLDGMTVFGPDKFDMIRQRFENREATFGQLRTFSDIITNIYRADGYITSRAYLPPQTVNDGAVEIKVLEGKTGKIIVDGNHYFSAGSYEKYIQLGSGHVLRYQDLENALYYINRQPDRQAKLYLEPGKEPGTSDIILKASDRNPLHVYYDFNNHGTKLTHYERHSLHLDHNNFLGHDDVLNTGFTTTSEGAFDAFSFNYNFPLERIPADISFTGGYVKTMLIGRELKPLEIKGESMNFTPAITYRFVEKPALEIDGYAGFDYINSYSRISDQATSTDRMRVFKIGPRMSFQDTAGRTILNADANYGIPDFMGGLRENNDPHASIVNSGGGFTFYTVNAARLQRLPYSLLLIARAGGQWSADTLTAVEQYRAGGAYTVRGYPESDSAGDSGYNGSLELNSPIPFLSKDWQVPYAKKSWADSLHVVGFLDAAQTFFRERARTDTVKDRFLLGTGFGLRLDLSDYMSAQADLGFPIGDESSDGKHSQIHLAVRSGF